MLRIDQVLNQRYRIVRQLGHGGMGAVYEAIDERFGEPIALKEVVFATSDDKQKDLIVKAFEREAKALAKAQHEAVPYVRDYFSELDRQFLVMELVEGDDLAELVAKRQSPFPLLDCLKWLDQLLDALDYLHTLARPIIHRDIKPQNLKLSRRGKIKLLDFGIAKSSETATSTLSDQTFIGATLDYSPIEQILRAIDATFREFIILKHREKAENVLSQTTDTRCDIYALGATFYHLLTNQAPPDAVKRTLEVWEERPDPLINPSVLNPTIPPRVSNCLLKAMSIEREERFASALEMQEAIKDAVAEDKILENSVYNESWKAEQLRLQVIEEARRREQMLMQAKTAVLTAKDVPAAKPVDEDTSYLQSLPTERLLVVPSDTDAVDQISANESSSAPALNTIPSGSVSANEFSGAAYSGDTVVHRQKTEIYEGGEIAALPARKKTSKALWILPVAALGVFGIGGIGGAFWMINPGSSGTDNENVNSTFPPTPTSTPSPVASPTQSIPEGGSSFEPLPDRTPRQTPVATPISTPVRTPQPTPIKTPPKTPPPKTPDPNCVYNNTCN